MTRPEPLLALLVLAAGCDRACTEASGDIALTDANNYAFVGELEIQSTALAEGDFTFAWSGVTTDLQGHAVDPVADIDNASIVVFRYLSQQDVLEGLATNSLLMADVGLYVGVEPEGATQLSLSDLMFMGTDIDVEQYFAAEYCVSHGYCAWMLSLTTGTKPGVGARVAAFVEPSPGASAAHIELTDDSSAVLVDADLRSLEPVTVPIGVADLEVSWGGVTTTGQGVELRPTEVDQLMIARYDLGLEELEARFLDLELIASDLWVADLPGGTTSSTGILDGFPGVDDQGTWILALRCTECANPAPPVLTVLHPCD